MSELSADYVAKSKVVKVTTEDCWDAVAAQAERADLTVAQVLRRIQKSCHASCAGDDGGFDGYGVATYLWLVYGQDWEKHPDVVAARNDGSGCV